MNNVAMLTYSILPNKFEPVHFSRLRTIYPHTYTPPSAHALHQQQVHAQKRVNQPTERKACGLYRQRPNRTAAITLKRLRFPQPVKSHQRLVMRAAGSIGKS